MLKMRNLLFIMIIFFCSFPALLGMFDEEAKKILDMNNAQEVREYFLKISNASEVATGVLSVLSKDVYLTREKIDVLVEFARPADLSERFSVSKLDDTSYALRQIKYQLDDYAEKVVRSAPKKWHSMHNLRFSLYLKWLGLTACVGCLGYYFYLRSSKKRA